MGTQRHDSNNNSSSNSNRKKPEANSMWDQADLRVLRQQSQTVHRLIFVGSLHLLYRIAYVCHFFKLRYNKTSQQMDERQYHRVVSKLIISAKFLLFAREVAVYLVMGTAIWIHFFRVEDSMGQNFLMGCIMQINNFYVLRRILVFLHAQADRLLLQRLINEMIDIKNTIEQKYGMVYHCELSVLVVYLCKLFILYIMLDALWYKPHFTMANFMYWLLLEYCVLGYFVYQMTVLNWYRNFTFFLHGFIEEHKRSRRIGKQYHRRLLSLFKLHLRISNLHQCLDEWFGWLPKAIYMSIFTCVFYMTLLLECIIYATDEIENKIYIISDGCMGYVFVPLLNVLIIGLCTDRLRSAELILQQQIVITNILYLRKAPLADESLKVLYNEHTSLIVHQKLKPLENVMILGITCDRSFAFDFFMTVIVTALSFIQYTLSTNRMYKECRTVK